MIPAESKLSLILWARTERSLTFPPTLWAMWLLQCRCKCPGLCRQVQTVQEPIVQEPILSVYFSACWLKGPSNDLSNFCRTWILDWLNRFIVPLWPCKLLSSLRLRVLTAASLAATALQCVHCSLEASCLQQFCEVCHVRVFIQLWSAAYASVRRWHVMARTYLLKRERERETLECLS